MTAKAEHKRGWIHKWREKRRLKREREGDTPAKLREERKPPEPELRDPRDRTGTGGPATGPF
jgi:hypothetical protein